MRHNAEPSTVPACIPNPVILRVNGSMTIRTQWDRNVADSHLNRSRLQRLSSGPGLAWRFGEDSYRYLGFFMARWRFERVEGFSTIAERIRRVGGMKDDEIMHFSILTKFGNA